MLLGIAWEVAVVRHDGCGYICGFLGGIGRDREGGWECVGLRSRRHNRSGKRAKEGEV